MTIPHSLSMLIQQSRFLVTGGAGFIGSHLVDFLLKHHAQQVVIVDNFSTGTFENIQSALRFANCQLIEGDLQNRIICEMACEGIDFVFHQAALGSVPRSIHDPISTHQANVNSFVNLLVAMQKAQVKKMVFASSSSVYGSLLDDVKQEITIGEPLSPYAATKRINEIYADIFAQTYQQDLIGLRYFNVFGPRQNPDGPYAAVIPKFIQSVLEEKAGIIFGDGEQSRDFTYIDNVVYANILALLKHSQEYRFFNIACGQSISLNQVWNAINIFCEAELPVFYQHPRQGDILHSRADISRAKQCLNYQPFVYFNEGIRRTISWYQSQRTHD
ncbi:NAD-dependent epimerase/dehydratase family protein [Flectobacillus sp. DC10W]|uniref:NAD-dependent epimerase/dehydratase family protein n=1 Tax=Flectobacillus longus TaxID=2984207 RepID=A0ABT6YRN9_9BACT|nr:NAD-dependent epimerase/dehydratase family protein [Flectobacillus longus]MDI9866241.1 NAD-dependent epimerase/dehydratase family protein [Flectobacillus longus]